MTGLGERGGLHELHGSVASLFCVARRFVNESLSATDWRRGCDQQKSAGSFAVEEVTLAERFREHGYATGIYGKWHLGNHAAVWPLEQGFDEWQGTVGSNDMGPGRPSLQLRRAGKAGVEWVTQSEVSEINPDQTLLTRRTTDLAIDFIDRNQEGPFFLYLPYNMPHTPLFVSDAFSGSTVRGLYGDVIAELDDSVGRILDALERFGKLERTIIAFTSDNGPWLIFGDHGGSNGGLRWEKANP